MDRRGAAGYCSGARIVASLKGETDFRVIREIGCRFRLPVLDRDADRPFPGRDYRGRVNAATSERG
jgi:hypothetical protein